MAVRLIGPAGMWTLPLGPTLVGRGRDCSVRIRDPRLSRAHARVVVAQVGAVIEDLGSTNGVLRNGDRIQGRATLADGDALVLGPVLLRVQIDVDEVPTAIQAHPAIDPGGSGHHDTDAMLGAVGRRIDPDIAAAAGAPVPTTVSHQPSPAAVPTTALSSVRSDASPSPSSATQDRRRTTSDLLPPSDASRVATEALDCPGTERHAPDVRRRRLLAGLLDGGQVLLVAQLGGLLAVLLGFRAAGGALLPLMESAGRHAAWTQVLGWRSGEPQAFLFFFAGITIGLLLMVMTPVLLLIAPTVLSGAPFWHRRLGLVVVRARNGHYLGWWRATARWLLVPVLAPVGLVCVLLGRRSPHDVITGCRVHRRASG